MQTTHCYQLHKDELSQENIEALQTPCYISLGELANLYSPQIADDVKARYNFEDDELVDYLSTYASLGLRYPEGYLETFLSKLYGYWYPTAHSIDITESTPMTSVALSDFSPQEDAIELEDEETSGNTRNYTDALPAIKSAPKMLLNVFAGAPFTALLFSARVLPVGMLASRTIPRHNMQSQRFRLRTHCRDYADLLRLSPQRIAALCAAARLSASHTPGMARN